ncbi:hypothetical protein Bbelb_162030 [Branchiostoma belcheri]|nr:hypothetical protein Bbelb_162030 [Branchiostoma belcheri]
MSEQENREETHGGPDGTGYSNDYAPHPGPPEPRYANSDDHEEEPYEYKEPEDVNFAYMARDRLIAMYNRGKASKLCRRILCCGLQMIVLIVTVAILVPCVVPRMKEAHMSTAEDDGAKLEEPSTPWMMIMGNSSDVTSSTSPYLPSSLETSGPASRSSMTVRQCQSEWSKYNNHCYKLMHGKVSWFEAEEQCKRLGTRVWIGLRKVRRWQWSDGSRVIYRNWNPGEPNSSILPKKGSGKCATLYMKDARRPRIAIGPRNKKGKWNNFVCNMKYPFLCKVPN